MRHFKTLVNNLTFPALLAVLLLLLTTGAAQADTVEDYVLRGQAKFYNFNFNGAAQDFKHAIEADPNDPRGYFFMATIHLWTYIFDRDEDQVKLFMGASQKTMDVAEAQLKRNSSDSRAKLFLGLAHGYRAIAHARAENVMAGALSGKACYDNLEEVVRKDPKQYDAYLGLGIFHFAVGSIPKTAQAFAGIIGIKGDAELGLREMKIAASKGTYFKNDATLILAMLDIFYRQEAETGIKSLEKLAARYPQNAAFQYVLGNIWLEQKDPEKAVKYFDKVTAHSGNTFRTLTDMSYGRAGMAFFSLNRFDKAKTYLQKFLRNSKEEVFRAHAWYLLGVCNEIEGNRELAISAYKRAREGVSHSTSWQDRYASRKARKLMKEPLTKVDIELIRALNSNASSNWNDAMQRAENVLKVSGLTPEQKAMAHYAIGQALQGQKKYKDAIDRYRRTTAMGIHGERWVTPFSYYYMAECYKKLGDRTKWKEYIEQAKRYGDFDNEELLQFMIERDVTLID